MIWYRPLKTSRMEKKKTMRWWGWANGLNPWLISLHFAVTFGQIQFEPIRFNWSCPLASSWVCFWHRFWPDGRQKRFSLGRQFSPFPNFFLHWSHLSFQTSISSCDCLLTDVPAKASVSWSGINRIHYGKEQLIEKQLRNLCLKAQVANCCPAIVMQQTIDGWAPPL